MRKLTLILTSCLLFAGLQAQNIKLPQPQKEGGESILKAIDLRQSDRSFKDGDISLQDLSTLLWAGWGESHGKRTAPTAMNAQDITLYVFLESGIYRYDEKANELILIKQGDYRKLTDREGGFAGKVTNVAIVSDFAKYDRIKDHHTKFVFGSMSAAYVSENMYLACAGMKNNIGTVTRYAAHTEKQVKEVLPLKESEHILLFQTIGYKK